MPSDAILQKWYTIQVSYKTYVFLSNARIGCVPINYQSRGILKPPGLGKVWVTYLNPREHGAWSFQFPSSFHGGGSFLRSKSPFCTDDFCGKLSENGWAERVDLQTMGPFLGLAFFSPFSFQKSWNFLEGKATERIFVCPSTQLQKSDSHQQQGRKTWHSTYYIMLYTVFDVNLHKVLHTSQYVIYGYMYIYIYIYFRFPIVAPFDWLFLMERVFITREVIPNFGRTGPLILIDLLKWHVNFQDEWNQNNKSCRVVPPEFPQ